ncbi:hypothetical protein Agub_g15183, partial [Astrephomene gubernaculifera]
DGVEGVTDADVAAFPRPRNLSVIVEGQSVHYGGAAAAGAQLGLHREQQQQQQQQQAAGDNDANTNTNASTNVNNEANSSSSNAGEKRSLSGKRSVFELFQRQHHQQHGHSSLALVWSAIRHAGTHHPAGGEEPPAEHQAGDNEPGAGTPSAIAVGASAGTAAGEETAAHGAQHASPVNGTAVVHVPGLNGTQDHRGSHAAQPAAAGSKELLPGSTPVLPQAQGQQVAAGGSRSQSRLSDRSPSGLASGLSYPVTSDSVVVAGGDENRTESGKSRAGGRAAARGGKVGGRGGKRGKGGGGVRAPLFAVNMRTASGRRHVPLVLRPCFCGVTHMTSSNQFVRGLLKDRKERGEHEMDAAEFFWFGKPKLMTILFTLAYFENSLSIAICIFTLAGTYRSAGTWEGVPLFAVVLQLVLDILLMPQVSFNVLPLYALIQPLGSHCPSKWLEKFMKKHYNPKQYKRVQRLLDRYDPPVNPPPPAKPSGFFSRLSTAILLATRRGHSGQQPARAQQGTQLSSLTDMAAWRRYLEGRQGSAGLNGRQDPPQSSGQAAAVAGSSGRQPGLGRMQNSSAAAGERSGGGGGPSSATTATAAGPHPRSRLGGDAAGFMPHGATPQASGHAVGGGSGGDASSSSSAAAAAGVVGVQLQEHPSAALSSLPSGVTDTSRTMSGASYTRDPDAMQVMLHSMYKKALERQRATAARAQTSAGGVGETSSPAAARGRQGEDEPGHPV